MARFDPAPLLPVTRLEINSGATRHVGKMVLLPSDTYSNLIRDLAHMAQVSNGEVTPFLQRTMTREIVRITSDMDLMREQPVGLVAVVGLCSVCNKGVPLEFHPCPLGEDINAAGFRLQVGPVQRLVLKETVRITGDTDLRHVPCGCAVCDKERDGVPVEFHACPRDEIIESMGFRSPVGPIQRPPHGIVA